MVQIDRILKKPSAQLDYATQIEWFIQIAKWMRLNREVNSRAKIPPEMSYAIRLKYLLQMLDSNPEWKKNFSDTIAILISRASSTRLFTEVGIASQNSFIQDFISRVEEKILPQNPLTEDLSNLLAEAFPEEIDIFGIDHIPEETLNQLLSLFSHETLLKEHLNRQLCISTVILSSQLISNWIRICKDLSKPLEDLGDFPELKLQQASLKLSENLQLYRLPDFLLLLSLAETRRLQALSAIEQQGVKIDLIYALESQRRNIERLKTLYTLLLDDSSKALNLRFFISQLIADIHHQKSLRAFFAENLSLLTQRIVQRNSDVGEHYVTHTQAEFNKMFHSGLGGGAIVSLTVFVKFAIGTMALKGFLKGLAEGLNYSGSFLFVQMMGWTIATKQPSTTAPYLTESLKKSLHEAKASVVAILRTQFIAVVGNLTLVFPICFLISLISVLLQKPILSTDSAIYAFYAPSLLGPAPFFAIFTGGLLFLSSLFAGWFDNWVTIHKVAERISGNRRLPIFLGKRMTQSLANLMHHSANAIAGNISLGLLLGLTPQYFQFFSIPMEVRHITISAGSLAAALPVVLQNGLPLADLIISLLGVLAIGAINISVSFGLALFLAALSSRIRFSVLWKIVKWGLNLLITRPSLLLFPEKK